MELEDIAQNNSSKLLKPAEKKKRGSALPPNAGKGRVKGVPNKSTKAVKDALQEAFTGLGGVPALINWAKEDRAEFYKLWAKLLPNEVKAVHSGSVTLERLIAGEPGEE